jgi:MATE family multidrug resistance protein
MPQSTWGQRWREPGGGAELLRLALPLILSNSFWAIQVSVDRVLLSRQDTDAVGAVMAAVMLFWTLFQLPHSTANYVTNFVAQYHGAGRPWRIGPVVWQGLYFSLASGLAFLALILLAEGLVALGDHHPRLQELEAIYFRIMCCAALPLLLQAAAAGFFTGLGEIWIVVLMNAVGMLVNVLVAWVLIFGHWGFPEMGIAGAGWAMVAGSWASALLGLVVMFCPHHCRQYALLSGWRFDPALCGRLLRFGIPAGLQWTLDALAWTLFVWMVGRLGKAELAATSIAFNLNLLAYMPTMGIAQAGAVLLGQRLGEERPTVAERSVWTAFRLAWWCMAILGTSLILLPEMYLGLFQPVNQATLPDSAPWPEVAGLTAVLLWFVAGYCLFDSMNLIFAFALKGAGDVRYVTVVSLVLAWVVMVLPTWIAVETRANLYWAWTCATSYVISLALVFLWRFCQGKWKTLRLIEPAVIEVEQPPAAATPSLVEDQPATVEAQG